MNLVQNMNPPAFVPQGRTAGLPQKILGALGRRCTRLKWLVLKQVYLYRIRGPLIVPQVRTGNLVEIRQWSPELVGVEISEKKFQKLTAFGATLYAWKKDSEWVSFGWIAEKDTWSIKEVGRDYNGGLGAYWLIAFFTPERHRGNHYYPAFLQALVTKFGDRGIIYCRKDNNASRRGIGRAGFSLDKKLIRLCGVYFEIACD